MKRRHSSQKHSAKRRSSRDIKLWIVLGLIAFVILIALLYKGGRWLETRSANPETRGDLTERYADVNTIEVDGVTYQEKSNITTILLMGIDVDSTEIVTSGRNGGQADFLRLLVIDSDAETVSQLEIDRDTMAVITILGVLGNRSGERTEQISLSHGFGDGGEESCELTVEAVSNLLLGVEIDYYIAMNLDGISVLNDFVGGVTVTLVDDFTSVDETMTAGTTLTLTGDQAEIYVRTRRTLEISTNEARMVRQQNYISLLTELLDEVVTDSNTLGNLYDELDEYLTTDMSRGRLINVLWAAKDYSRSDVISIEGTYELGSDGFNEFYADDDSIQAAVLELYYTAISE